MLKWLRIKSKDRRLGVGNSIFLDVFRTYKNKCKFPPDDTVKYACAELRFMVLQGSLNLRTLVNDVLCYTVSRFCHEDRPEKLKLMRLLLLEILDIIASCEMDDRNLVRKYLKFLFAVSRCIDKEVLLFEEAQMSYSVIDVNKVRKKTEFILRQTSGWVISSDVPPWKNSVSVSSMPACYYLELPYHRGNSCFTTILAEAMYRLQDVELVQSILRSAVRPYPFYLWPIAIQADLKILLSSSPDHPTADTTTEMEIIDCFCRVHKGFRKVILEREFNQQMMASPEGIIFDDIIVVTARTASLIPENWWRNPCPLQHYCRLVIRSHLCKLDYLPHGIYELPLPTPLKTYLDCLE